MDRWMDRLLEGGLICFLSLSLSSLVCVCMGEAGAGGGCGKSGWRGQREREREGGERERCLLEEVCRGWETRLHCSSFFFESSWIFLFI